MVVIITRDGPIKQRPPYVHTTSLVLTATFRLNTSVAMGPLEFRPRLVAGGLAMISTEDRTFLLFDTEKRKYTTAVSYSDRSILGFASCVITVLALYTFFSRLTDVRVRSGRRLPLILPGAGSTRRYYYCLYIDTISN